MSNALLLVRLFTREQVIEMYGIRPDIEEKFFEGCPVLYQSCGEDIYKEVSAHHRHPGRGQDQAVLRGLNRD